MTRRVICAVALAACAGAYLFAASARATFILVDGQRKSGIVVFHTDDRVNLFRGRFSLGNDDGSREQEFPLEQVAVIVFVAGTPAAAERQALQALPDGDNLIALRDGTTAHGRFVNLIGGDTVRWMDPNGSTREIPIGETSRIYLNPSVSRAIFNITAADEGPAAAPEPTVLEPGAIAVQANQAWTETGRVVRKGDRVTFRATGRIAFGRSPGQTAGPEGNTSERRAVYPVTGLPAGALIGKVGDSTPFAIGDNGLPIVMPADGRLLLGINDNELVDNSGFFSVVVTPVGR